MAFAFRSKYICDSAFFPSLRPAYGMSQAAIQDLLRSCSLLLIHPLFDGGLQTTLHISVPIHDIDPEVYSHMLCL
jgi:hypothetical protein